MQQVASVWNALDPQRRAIALLASVAVFAAVISLSVIAARPSMSLLFAGLESGPAGDVVAALEQRGAVYDVRGGAIFVESAHRDELRMTLASEGLPAQSSQGYELLDSLSGFGTTSQMFDAAYWRAKEGELARTIVSSPHVAAARVHIANTGSNPFQRDVRPTASVSLNSTGGAISAVHARAVRHLVAAAVPGMTPEAVSVIDGNGSLVGGAEDSAPAETSEDRAEVIRARVQRLLEAHVGFGNAVVEVSVDTVTQSESIVETHIDPASRVAISTDTEERSDSARDAGGGDVSVASNLPTGDAAAGESSSSQTSETRERINYEVSQTTREVVRAPGEIRRLTVAVLVNGLPGAEGEAFQPRPEAQLETLRELVSSAVGFNAERGDAITLKSMPFEPIAQLGSAPATGWLAGLGLNVMSLVQMAMLSLVALLLGLFVVRPILTPRLAQSDPVARIPSGTASSALPSLPGAGGEDGDADLPPLTGEIADDAFDLPDLSSLSGGGLGGDDGFQSLAGSDDPVDRLRAMISERREETVEILKGWLEESEESA